MYNKKDVINRTYEVEMKILDRISYLSEYMQDPDSILYLAKAIALIKLDISGDTVNLLKE